MNETENALFLIHSHSCFLNHTNIIYVAIFTPVYQLLSYVSLVLPPSPIWEVKGRLNGQLGNSFPPLPLSHSW